MEDPDSAACRSAAFEWLQSELRSSDATLSRSSLEIGFPYNSEFVRLVGPQGIFKPKQIAHYPLSITTTTKGPYQDSFDPSGDMLLYSYRGADPNFHENRKLRDAYRDQIPLIYFFSTIPGIYLAIYPVFIVGDNPTQLTFEVAADDMLQLRYERDDTDDDTRRIYITRQVRQRMHQRSFRDRVLRAYEERCSICELRHTRLLDAAHIIPDKDEGGEPVVSNGLSLCKIHHAAYDSDFIGIRPDYQIVVRPDLLDEKDGPMLKHGIQEINDQQLNVPKRVKERPDPERLRVRFNEFSENAHK